MHATEKSTADKDDSKNFPQPRPVRLAIVRKSLLSITGDDATAAMILDKFLHWADRGHRSDGWIWKSSKELARVDLMGIKSARSVQRRLARLVEVGYLERRPNPDDPRDHVPQYRANISLIYNAVTQAGYSLEGWTTAPDRHGVATSRQNDAPLRQNDEGSRQNDATLPESTSKETNQRATAATRAREAPPGPVATADTEDDPAQKLLVEAEKAEIDLTIYAAEKAWATVSNRTDDDTAWEYLRWKLADLSMADLPRRSKARYLAQDLDDWLKDRAEKQVGAHTERDVGRHAKPPSKPTTPATPTTPPDPPGGPATSAEKDRGDELWAKTQEFLDSELPPVEREAAHYLECIACRDGVLYLWPEIAEAGSTLRECWDTVRDAVQRVGGHDAVLMDTEEDA